MKKILIASTFFLFSVLTWGQTIQKKGVLSGNFQLDGTYYTDTVSTKARPELFGVNAYGNFNYTYGDFSAGLRYELYQPPMMGYDMKYKGLGISYKYLSYRSDNLTFILGNFYEQFGSGMILRSYEEKTLGYDNALEGISVKYNPYRGIYLKGLVGKQRSFWESNGLIRGIDGEFIVNDIFKIASEKIPYFTLGGSFVSKYQDPTNTTLYLPANVGSGAARMGILYKKINLSGEYVYKANDPSADNNFIYKEGQGLLINATYSTRGLGIYLTAKRLDNMYFRSDRNASGTAYLINNPPAVAQEHTYSLSAMYPFATQANGEMGLQSSIAYKFKKKSLLGGKYGTKVTLSYSDVYDIKRNAINENTAIGEKGTMGYTSSFTELGQHMYVDANIKIHKKISKKLKGSFIQQYQEFDNTFFHVGDYHATIYTNITVLDVTYKINKHNAIRTELEHLYTQQDKGSWAMLMLEYTISPHWFFVVWDQWNYGNPVAANKEHFYNASFGYIKNSNRIQLSYGKQREGVVCAGGVCRFVPAFEGVMISMTSTF